MSRAKDVAYKEAKEIFEKRSHEENLIEAINLLEQTYYALYQIAKNSSEIHKEHPHHLLSKMQTIVRGTQKIGEIGKCMEGISKFVFDDIIHLL